MLMLRIPNTVLRVSEKGEVTKPPPSLLGQVAILWLVRSQRLGNRAINQKVAGSILVHVK